jgi:hypothetical protein
MKNLIGKDNKYIEAIGKTLHVEKFDDGSEFYCLLDKYGNFNVVDTGRTYEEIKIRIDKWNDLILRGVVAVK